MATTTVLQSNIDETCRVLQAMHDLAPHMEAAVTLLTESLRGGGKLMCCGNGGSAADAGHFAAEFICRFQRERRPFPAIALADTPSTVTAICNDYDFEQLFARQVEGLAQKGDVLVVFTTSGNSANVIAALETANRVGIQSVALLGNGGGKAKGLATVELIVPHNAAARVQEGHLVLYHTLCEQVEAALCETGT